MIPVPNGYARLEHEGADVVVLADCTTAVREVLRQGTLYAWGEAHPERRVFAGRVPAYAVPLPYGGPVVVVRHVQHGGLLASLTRDLFLAPTRAPYELGISLLMHHLGIATPRVAGYAVYRAAPLVRRADVMTIEIAGGLDLGKALIDADDAARQALLPLVASLMRALARAGAWHPDLNVKNILLAPDAAGTTRAHVLDVDRVRLVPPGDPHVAAANFDRLARSARKWRALHGAGFDEAELSTLRELIQHPAA